jgi:LysM repeat protein
MRISAIIALSFFCGMSSIVVGNKSLEYINRYKEVAITEMNYSGIPASIKMAQALLESGAGQSTLAREANNHFGIKCGGSWDGDTFYREDDDYENGKLIKSCFRKFENVHESFSAHTDFLVNQKRYAFLFDIDKKDYHGWAHGLRKAGYATDKAYPDKLINLIEKYRLYELDENKPEQIIASHDQEESRSSRTKRSESSKKNRKSFSLFKKEDRSNNRTSSRSKKSRSSKSNSSRSTADYHVVEKYETISEIAQAHGIEEKSLRLRNRLPKDAEPLEGEKVYLRKKISLLRRPEFVRVSDNSIAASEYIF